MKIELYKENNAFAEGGFRHAFLPTDKSNTNKWVSKEYKMIQMDPVFAELKMTADQHTRKQVQMHSVDRSIAQSLQRKLPSAFGKSFSYNKVYYATIDKAPVTVEQYIPEVFEKYVNNNGDVAEGKSPVHEAMIEKASCFAHFSYVHTERQMMVFDLQGVGYKLCDPEIATITLLEDGELNFCAGNLSSNAIQNFFAHHCCNKYCKMLAFPGHESIFD